MDNKLALSPETILTAYSNGAFPMAESKNHRGMLWISPDIRGVIPLANFHISKSLRRLILRNKYRVTVNKDFVSVINSCASRSETWINTPIRDCYIELWRKGYCHSIEVWDSNEIIGGIYGLALKKAFFGESMFSKKSNGSKIALAYLVSRLKFGGFTLFDTQFLTSHLESLGGIEITATNYQKLLLASLEGEANFLKQPEQVCPVQVCT
ncbi:MAG: leucyl/phenylalanyl-tRNA--protein transferase [Paracoccaceae bacterium]|jgi:leucyl/phenylalanyl-tRNA--protein transferase